MKKYEARIVSSSMMIIPRFMKIGWVIRQLLRRGHIKTDNNAKALYLYVSFKKLQHIVSQPVTTKNFQKTIFKVILLNWNSCLKLWYNFLAIMPCCTIAVLLFNIFTNNLFDRFYYSNTLLFAWPYIYSRGVKFLGLTHFITYFLSFLNSLIVICTPLTWSNLKHASVTYSYPASPDSTILGSIHETSRNFILQ
jgi:hypothetical protein